jgi:hypothetical protein
MNLAEAIKQRQQNTKDQFYTNMMQYALRNSPQFDMSGKKPVYIGGISKMPSKTQLWNQFIQIKGGRLSPQDLAEFEQYYQSTVASHNQNQLKGLQELAIKGYSDKKIRGMVDDSPDLYKNLLDMVSTFESQGSEEGMVAASRIRNFLPMKNEGVLFEDSEDKSNFQKLVPIVGAVTAYKGIKHLSQKNPATKQTNWQSYKKKYPKIASRGKTPAAILAYMTAEPIGEYLGGETGGDIARKGLDIGMIGQGLRMGGRALMGKGPWGTAVGGGLLGAAGLYDLIYGE